jgi:hypothetical protein
MSIYTGHLVLSLLPLAQIVSYLRDAIGWNISMVCKQKEKKADRKKHRKMKKEYTKPT